MGTGQILRLLAMITPLANGNSAHTRSGCSMSRSLTEARPFRSSGSLCTDRSMSSTKRKPPGRRVEMVLRSLNIFPPGASGKIRSNEPMVPTRSAPSPTTIDTHSGQEALRVWSAISSSSSTLITSTSVRPPIPWTIHESPTPLPVPISNTRPPIGTALARQAISSPTSGSDDSSKPRLFARASAATTRSGSSIIGPNIPMPLRSSTWSPTSESSTVLATRPAPVMRFRSTRCRSEHLHCPAVRRSRQRDTTARYDRRGEHAK